MTRPSRLFVLICASLCLAGCDDWLTFKWNLNNEESVDEGLVQGDISDIANSLAYKDTIAERAWFEGLRRMRVRGYGLVVGLGRNGSRECPVQVREQLLSKMYKLDVFARQGMKPAPISPERLIDDLDTAVVAVEGEIPAAGRKGESFDVWVRALPGTQTISLEGGQLYTAELHIYRENQVGSWVEGSMLATAAGPVFVNPFGAEDEAATSRNPREGIVIGGGEATEDRRLRLVLSNPSHQVAKAVCDRLNSRFGGSTKIAKAEGPGYIDVEVPREWADDPFHFIALIRHLYLPVAPGFSERRAQDLAIEILAENAPHPDIALAWEGIGRTVLPVVQQLYTAELPHARFYAALAGMRMDDEVAVGIVAEFAEAPQSPYRLTAIEELGRAKKVRAAAIALRKLLDDEDPRIRVEAYEALLFRDDRYVYSRSIDDGAFRVDRVPSNAEPLIYVRRTGEPRIAVFGTNVKCRTPLFYTHPDGLLTVSAEPGDEELTMFRKARMGEIRSPAVQGPREVSDLVCFLGATPYMTEGGDVEGLGMPYGSITHLLHTLCADHSIDAKFMLQSTSVQELFGPISRPGRPESDL